MPSTQPSSSKTNNSEVRDWSQRRSLRAWLRRPGRLLASALLALAAAILIIFRDAILPQIFQAEDIGDRVREIRGDPALQIVRVESIKLADEHDTFARSDNYALDPSQAHQIQDILSPASGPIIDRARKTSLPAPFATWRIYLRGGRNETVRLLDIRPVNIKRSRPLSGTLFYIPPQGADSAQLMGVNMDSPNPQARELTTDPGVAGGSLGQSYFGNKTISLSDKEDQIIVFRALSKRYSVSFDLAVDYQVGAEHRRETITNNGQPFRFTAYSCTQNGTLDYERYYSLGGDPTFGLYPDIPDRQPHNPYFCG